MTGQVLPSERELAMRFGVSAITVRQVLTHLELAGNIYRVSKVGTFAGPRPRGGPMRRSGRICVELLLPALGYAREQARITVCGSNLH